MQDGGVDSHPESGNPLWAGRNENPQPGPARAADTSGRPAPGCGCREGWGSVPGARRGLAESLLSPRCEAPAISWGGGPGAAGGAGAVASASELLESSGRRGRPPFSGGGPGLERDGAQGADPDASCSGPGGGRAGWWPAGQASWQPRPSRWPVFVSSPLPGPPSRRPQHPLVSSAQAARRRRGAAPGTAAKALWEPET